MASTSGSLGDPLLRSQTTGLEVPEHAIHLVYLTVFIDTLAGAISTPMMPYYTQSFGVSKAAIGWLYGAWSFSSTAFAPFLGALSDRYGRRPVLILSLVGAGVSNLIQGLAPVFWVFLLGRFLSGIWAAVGSTCSVYISDVAPEGPLRQGYMRQQSMVPILAMLFGPGLGGGLAKLGLNVPIMVDAIITLFSACVMSYYLPETPAFLRQKMATQSVDDPKKGEEPAKPKASMNGIIHLLGFASFLGGFGFSTMLATFAIFMQERFDFDPLRIGFCFTGSACVMIVCNVWLVPTLQQRLSDLRTSTLGSILNGTFMILFALSPNLPIALSMYGCSGIGMTMRNATSNTVVASFTDTHNRGATFGLMQRYVNLGRMCGPIVATHIGDAFGWDCPVIVSGCLSISGALILLLCDQLKGSKPGADAAPAAKAAMKRAETAFGSEWKDEEYTAQDVEAIGQFMAKLLTSRHYKISKRDEIFCMLDQLLPELETKDRDAYDQSLAIVATKYKLDRRWSTLGATLPE